jgi:hypothetical protein
MKMKTSSSIRVDIKYGEDRNIEGEVFQSCVFIRTHVQDVHEVPTYFVIVQITN